MGPAFEKRMQKYKNFQYLRHPCWEMFFSWFLAIFFVGYLQKNLIFAPPYGSVFMWTDMAICMMIMHIQYKSI